MKKIIYTLFVLLSVVGLSNKAFAQTSVTPYLGGTYSYTLDGIDDVANTRMARIFVEAATDNVDRTADQAIDDATDGTDDYTVTHSSWTVTADAGGTPSYYDVAIPANQTSITFSVEYAATNGLTASTEYRLYLIVYDSDDNTGCSNYTYLTITPAANNFDLTVAATNASLCQVTAAPSAEDTPASDGQNTTFTYTVTKTGGEIDDDWSFDLDFTDNSQALGVSDITNCALQITTGAGTNSVAFTSSATGDYSIKVTNDDAANNASVVTVTVTVATEPGSPDAEFTGTVTAAKILENQTSTVVLAVEGGSGANNDTSTLNNLPSIGTFSGN